MMISLSTDLPILERNLTKIIEVEATTGLKLNANKCNIIIDYFRICSYP